MTWGSSRAVLALPSFDETLDFSSLCRELRERDPDDFETETREVASESVTLCLALGFSLAGLATSSSFSVSSSGTSSAFLGFWAAFFF